MCWLGEARYYFDSSLEHVRTRDAENQLLVSADGGFWHVLEDLFDRVRAPRAVARDLNRRRGCSSFWTAGNQ